MGDENREVIDTIWWTTRHVCTGVVICKDKITGEIKAYISGCEGVEKEADTHFIMNYGAKLLLHQVEAIMKQMKAK